MNQNIFRNAIRDVKKSTNNNFHTALKLDKNNICKEFTEEIDFEAESLNLGEELNSTEEKLNKNIKVTKLRSSMIDESIHSYPSIFDRKLEIKKNYEYSNSNLININNSNREIFLPKKNKNLVIRNSLNQEIVINDNQKKKIIEINRNNERKEIDIILNKKNDDDYDKIEEGQNWRHDKFNELIPLKFSIFIRSLPMNITENQLREIFSKFGPILSIYIERDTAEIYFPRKENAIEAVNKYNHSELNGKKIKVSFYENNDDKAIKKNNVSNNTTVINLEQIRSKKEPIILKQNNKYNKEEVILMEI